MPLVRVISYDRKIQKFVTADTLETLKDAAIKKLNLPSSEKYKVFLESCESEAGTEIDDTEIFLELMADAKNKNNHLSIMLVPEDDDWPSLSSNSDVHEKNVSTKPSDNVGLKENETSGTSTSSMQQSAIPLLEHQGNTEKSNSIVPLPMKPIVDVFQPVLAAMNSNEPTHKLQEMKKVAMRKVYKYIAEFILSKVKDYSKATINAYANMVFNYQGGIYKPIFTVHINDQLVDSGFSGFALQIYNCVNYQRDHESKKRVKRPHDETQNDDSITSTRNNQSDQYGCVAYALPLPDNETEEMQEEKRQKILSLTDAEESSAKDLMKETYPSQRADINRFKSSKELLAILNKWPLLLKSAFFLDHASILLGKNVIATWTTQLNNKTKDVNDYMSHFWSQEMKKSHPAKQAAEMLTLIRKKDEANEALRSQIASSIIIFPLIVAYMKEKPELFYQIIEPSLSDEDICSTAKSVSENPILLIKGESIFDTNAVCYVVILGQFIIKPTNILEGFLITFLTYFVFGFQYPTMLHSTLEFIQRYFLLINPSAGHKRPAGKRSSTTVDAKVKSLSEKLRYFTSSWT